MRTAMTLHPFNGDPACCLRNRTPNELIFTAQGDSGDSFNAIVPGAMRVRLIAPTSRDLSVVGVTRDGEVFHAQLARYDDEALIHSGVYLASMFAVVFVPGGEEFTGTALATVSIDEELPAIPRPPQESNPLTAEERLALQPAFEKIDAAYRQLAESLSAMGRQMPDDDDPASGICGLGCGCSSFVGGGGNPNICARSFCRHRRVVHMT